MRLRHIDAGALMATCRSMTRWAKAAFLAGFLPSAAHALDCEIVVARDGGQMTIAARAASPEPGPVRYRVVTEITRGTNVSVSQQSGAGHLAGNGAVTQMALSVVSITDGASGRIVLDVERGAAVCHAEHRLMGDREI